MQHYEKGIQFETILDLERARLVRLCAWFSGNAEAAEDLAQETLMAAWRSKDQLVSPDKLKPWTAAIARNVCLNWCRRHYREQAHILDPVESEEHWEDQIPDNIDIESELDRNEMAQLLDQALSLLPTETAQILVEYYLKESSQAEIAEMMGINRATVAVRLQRGRQTLQRLLQTKLGAQAAAFGLADENGPGWEDTNIWCPWCGKARLLGKFRKEEVFALRCPKCHPEPKTIMAGLDLSKSYHAKLLGKTRMYKPAYSRILTSFAPLYHQALKFNNASCLGCGRAVEIRVEGGTNKHEQTHKTSQIRLRCPWCGWASNKTLSSLVMASIEAQRFWREHQRIRILPPDEIDVQGSLSFLTRLQSMTSTAELTLISRRDTYELIEVHTNVKL